MNQLTIFDFVEDGQIADAGIRKRENVGYGDRSMIETEFLRLQGKIWGE